MILDKPEYISIQETEKEQDISIERLRWYAEKELLPVYVKSKHRFFKLIKPLWIGDMLDITTSEFLDNEGNPTGEYRYSAGLTDKAIFIKPSELENLSKSQNSSLDQTTIETQKENQSSPEEDVKLLREQNKPDAIIAYLLHEKYPDVNAFELMMAISPERVKQWDQSPSKQGRPKQWFYYLYKKGQKIIEDSKK